MTGNREHRAAYAGTGQALFILVFKNLFLTLITLGFYLPWARTERRKYIWQNIEFDGHRLRYHGTGKEMFVGYLKVAAGYALLIGLPAALTRVDKQMGLIAQVVGFLILFPLIPIAIYGSQRYLLGRTSLRGVRFGLEPGAGGYLRVFLVGMLLTLVTFGLYGPAMNNSLRRYIVERTRFGSVPFGYDGSNSDAFWITAKGSLLSVVTLGLYYPWFAAKLMRFRAESTFIQGARARVDITGKDVFWLLVTSIFGTVLSLGLAFPWITTYVMRTVVSKISFVGPIDYGAVAQRAPSGDAAADGLANALDVGLEV
jgi:uncharacterized membrane protein YjgN (DUF898 family)